MPASNAPQQARPLRLRRYLARRPLLTIAVLCFSSVALSCLLFAIWHQWGDGQQLLLPPHLRSSMDPKSGARQAPLHFQNRESFERSLAQGLERIDLPSMAQRAARQILPSVVHIRLEVNSDGQPKASGTKPEQRGSGSGVVIKDDGTILSNFHVVAAAASGKLIVSFADGSESEATVMQVMPDKDLAVLRPSKIPDDLQAATIVGSGNLLPGDQVVAVGFPFGIGPSVSAGVVSGLDREFRSPDGTRSLSGLIQFDAAANPGSSGGPLVNHRGEVVGIVTAILNPEKSRTFIGIGFATTMESAGAALGLPRF